MASVPQGTSAFDALLMKCRDLASEQLDAALSAMFEKADETLAEQTTKTTDREEQKKLLEARELARAKREEIEHQFHDELRSEFQRRSNKARQTGGGFADAYLSSMELSIVADEDLEESLKYNELAAKLVRMCEDEVNALDQRIGVLLGDAELETDANPLGAKAICEAWKRACHKTIESPEMRRVFLALFDALVLEAVQIGRAHV